MIRVPNGVVCVAVNGEVFFESGQSIRPGKRRRQSRRTNERSAQQTVVTCVQLITENDDSEDPVCEEFHDEFMMSRLVQPTVMTRTSVLQDPYPQGPHNERARGV